MQEAFEAEAGTDYLAKAMQFCGDFLADSRPYIGRYIATRILSTPDYQSTGLVIGTGAVGVGDAIDGRASRFAAKREGRETTPNGARKDDKSDKKWARILLEAQLARAVMDKDWKQVALLFICIMTIDTRDGIVTELRDEAQELDVDIKAGPWGKGKTGLQNAIFTSKNSRFARTELGRKINNAGQIGATTLSFFSGIVTTRKLKKGIAEAELAKDFAELKERFAA